jgi:hypothetical protein
MFWSRKTSTAYLSMPLSIAMTSSWLSGLLQSTPETSPAKTGCSGQIDTDMSTDIPQIPGLLGMIFRLIGVRRNQIRSQPASVSQQIVGSPALGVHPKPATAIALAIKPIPGEPRVRDLFLRHCMLFFNNLRRGYRENPY